MKEDIIKYKWKRGNKYADAPINSIRDLGKSILGELDTSTSFMYLFRRFGMPEQTNSDEYKILYCYEFKYKDMLFSVHASYYEHVYFNALMPKHYETERIKEYRKITSKLAKDSLSEGVIYMPYSTPYFNNFSESIQTKINKLYNDKAKEYFSEDDYKFLCDYKFSDELFANTPYHDKIEPFNKELCKIFRAYINEDQLKLFKEDTISNYPDLEIQCKEFFNELLRGYYVRDVPINIRGYENENNVIKLFENEEG